MKLFLQIEILLILKDQKVPLNLGVVVIFLNLVAINVTFSFMNLYPLSMFRSLKYIL